MMAMLPFPIGVSEVIPQNEKVAGSAGSVELRERKSVTSISNFNYILLCVKENMILGGVCGSF